jgi:DNA-directed RNA polymerase subunit beta'
MIDFGKPSLVVYCRRSSWPHRKKDELITRELPTLSKPSKSIEVKIQSVLSTKNLRGIPQKSYGIDMATGSLVAKAQPVGVIAAQSVGEPGTQLTLRTFHASGVAGGDITQGLPRVEELFEARNTKGSGLRN